MENKPLTERERIDALVFRLGISIRQLAKIVDMNENTFYHITDNSRFGISERTASKSCSGIEFLFSGLFFNFFIGGVGGVDGDWPLEVQFLPFPMG